MMDPELFCSNPTIRDGSLVVISLSLARQLKAYSQSHVPLEACAFLFGAIAGSQISITSFRATKNYSSNAHGVKLGEHARATAYCAPGFLGFYHSHLYSANPSRHDLTEIRRFEGELWMVGGLNGWFDEMRRRFDLKAFLSIPDEVKMLEVRYA